MGPELHLFLPGLRGPLPRELLADSAGLQTRLPALERIFARARRQVLPRRHWVDQLGALFGHAADELPAGALGWLGEGNDPGGDAWLRADPVHLQADRDSLMLFDAGVLAIAADEAAALIAACNELLRQDGLELLAPVPDRWYLRLDAPIGLHTTPTAAVAGRYVGNELPRGADAGRWLGLMTELQMVLHQATPNQEREASGRLTVNGLWFWGAGVLPAAERRWPLVVADEPTARGLARVAGARLVGVPAGATELNPTTTGLVVLTELSDALRGGDVERWADAVAALERQWLAPLLDRLRAGELGRLVVETDGLRLTLERRDLLRIWRRPRAWRYELEH